MMKLWRNFVIPIVLANVLKLYAHYLFPDEVIFPVVFLCFFPVLYWIGSNKFYAYCAASIGFATHELWFESIGHKLGLMYHQYVWQIACEAFIFSFVSLLLLHLVLKGLISFFR